MADSPSDIAMEILRAHGPLDDDQWADLLVDAGLGDDDQVWDLIEEDHPALGVLADGRNIALDSLLEGRVLTHRLTEAEIASGLIAADPDLGPLLCLSEDDVVAGLGGARAAFADLEPELFGDRALTDYAGETLVLEPAALAGFDIGTLVALQIVDGAPLLRVVTEPTSAPDLAEALAEEVPAESTVELDQVVWALMWEDPALFTTAAAPISELAAAAGFDLHGVHIARAGFDWAALDADSAMTLLMIRNDLTDRGQAVAVTTFIDLVRAVHAAAPERRDGILAAADLTVWSELADADVAWAVHTELFGDDDFDADVFISVADHLRRRGPRALRAAACWLAGKAAEHMNMIGDAERYFEDATTADPYWMPAVTDLVRYVIDRGDCARALSLLDRTDNGADTPVYAILQAAMTNAHPELGRNDRCWCGSGRKYKSCHLGKATLSATHRGDLLYQKAIAHIDQLAWARDRMDLAAIRSRHWESALGWMDAADDPLVVDVTLFECGGFDDFLRRRGELLPDEDLLIAHRWQLAPRSVFEIESIDSDIAVRDIRTGDRHVVRAPALNDELRVGEFYCCHLVPVGEQWKFAGSLEPVSLPQHGPLVRLLDDDTTDPRDIVEFLSARFARPQLVTEHRTPAADGSATTPVPAAAVSPADP
ncbi:SEC-C domain-containing protein [Nocardia sp. NPDC005366]|uniref:SEC-C domain-containing protein n=1 Tax=Nocardia sp. NPDC005366 TaxID=3156878 RepID=UPI0033BFB37E